MSSPKNNSFKDISAAKSVNDLLEIEDHHQFLYCAYRTFLHRDPEEVGLMHYLERLNRGERRLSVIASIALSDEAKAYDVEVKGLELALFKSKLFGLFGYKKNKHLHANETIKYTPHAQTSSSENQHLASPLFLEQKMTSQHKITKINEVDYLKSLLEEATNNPSSSIWVDLTTSLEWTGGVVGIVRAELEIAHGLHKVNNNIRFSMQKGSGFVEIKKSELLWLLNAENVTDAYMNFFGRYQEGQSSEEKLNQIKLELPDSEGVYYPYKKNDIVVSVGWMDSNKESVFSQVKLLLPSLRLGYLIYDTILINKSTASFYHKEHQDNFKKYFKWVYRNCDFLLFGGETAKLDATTLQREFNLPKKNGIAVRFGSDITKQTIDADEQGILESLGINSDFIITVGSIEPRKNHETIYRAYLLAKELDAKSLPKLIVCGKPTSAVADLIDSLHRNPELKDLVTVIRPTDIELNVLYKHCLFTLLPSVYEGWSLTLPESLSKGKLCLACDTPPLREIGKEMIVYTPAYDVRAWAENILHFAKNKSEVKKYEKRIADGWSFTKWQDTADQIYKYLLLQQDVDVQHEPEVWVDISMSYLYWEGGISGIIRTELTFAKHLYSLCSKVRFFAWSHNRYFEVTADRLLWLFDSNDLATDYKWFQEYWKYQESNGLAARNLIQGMDDNGNYVINEFPDNSILLFASIDWDQSRITAAVEMAKKKQNVMTAHVIYDMTPFVVPHLHAPATCEGYVPFVDYVSNHFDFIIYGGRTAQRDALLIQKENGWKSPSSSFVEFGSDINIGSSSTKDRQILESYNLTGPYILTVGTIEPRKNHDMLYKAYLSKMGESIMLPTLVIVGKKGWKSDDFLSVFTLDERVKSKIIIISPTDEELDVLYRNCMFTLLPSFYEGWSLTLPESLSYGKFCLTSNSDPLKETGRDLVEYINPLDTYAWANRIQYYATHPEEILQKESYIKEHWVARSWAESTQMLWDELAKAHHDLYNKS